MSRARARHILVNGLEQAEDLKRQILEGTDFGDLARQQSSCPSSARGGDLGEFGRGQMVPEFDRAVFEGEIGTVIGPVQTQFGYHLIEVTERND